MNNEEKQTNIV